jgi:hypothetical protein
MKTLIIEASGQTRFSWKSEHAISHFLHPLHLDSSLAIQIGSILRVNCEPLKRLEDSGRTRLDLNVMLEKRPCVFDSLEAEKNGWRLIY